MNTTVAGSADLLGLTGNALGASDWLTITQEAVNAFGRVTGDEQWIHCDAERAATGPFGGPIAHGYFSLSLIGPLFAQLLTVENASMVVNYGLDRVRFPAPVPVGARVRLTASVAEVTEINGAVQLIADATVEIEGAEKPGCVARLVYRYFV